MVGKLKRERDFVGENQYNTKLTFETWPNWFYGWQPWRTNNNSIGANKIGIYEIRHINIFI